MPVGVGARKRRKSAVSMKTPRSVARASSRASRPGIKPARPGRNVASALRFFARETPKVWGDAIRPPSHPKSKATQKSKAKSPTARE